MTFPLLKYRAKPGDVWRLNDGRMIEWVNVPADGVAVTEGDVKIDGNHPSHGSKKPYVFGRARKFSEAYPDYWVEVMRGGRVIKPIHSGV